MAKQRSVVIRGGNLIDSSGERSGDVVIVDGQIVEVGPGLSGDVVLDASGCFVMPGLVDLHCSVGEPGNEQAETIETASRAAALGGFTAVVAKPDTLPCVDSASVVRDVQSIAKGALCDVAVSGAITVGRAGTQLTPMAEMARLGVKLFTDAPKGVADVGLMRRALEYGSSLGVTITQHCEVAELSDGCVMNEGEWSSRMGVAGQPGEAEDLMVMRDIALVRLSGCPMHFLHLSSRGAVAMVEAAKASGLPITADVTPHHLCFSDDSVRTYDTSFKVTPPFRSDADRSALISGLTSGVIDAISTDHTPVVSEEKEEPFDTAPFGTLGLQYALAVAHTELDVDMATLVAAMSVRPAQIAGLTARHGGVLSEGSAANVCVFDPTEAWTIDASGGASLSSNVAFAGRQVTGKVRHTMHNGEAVVIDGVAQR